MTIWLSVRIGKSSIKSCYIDFRNEQSPTCKVVHETNKAHVRNLLPNRFLPSSVCKCHQYFLITISSMQYAPVSNLSNRPLLSGGDSSCSWVFYLCTGPKGESLHCRRGVGMSPTVSIMQSLTLSNLWSTPTKGYKQAAFHVRLIEKLVLEVVSQQYNGMQHTSPDTAL